MQERSGCTQQSSARPGPEATETVQEGREEVVVEEVEVKSASDGARGGHQVMVTRRRYCVGWRNRKGRILWILFGRGGKREGEEVEAPNEEG
jgi:hypothetical protein